MAWVPIGRLMWQLLLTVLHPDKHWDSSNIHHPVIGYDSTVLYLCSLIRSTVWNLMKHKDKFTFTSCKNQITLYTTVDCRMHIKCHNQWIHTNIWNGNNHIISMNWCPCIKTFSPFDRTESRTHKLCQKDPARHQNDTCSGWNHFVHSVITLSTKRIFNDTTVSSGIIKKKSNRKYPSGFLCVSYTVLFLTLNILRLSAMSQMGHKPMFWRPALLPSPESMQYKTPSHWYIYIYIYIYIYTSLWKW